jgi:sugar phosphate isomerase/epimerase
MHRRSFLRTGAAATAAGLLGVVAADEKRSPQETQTANAPPTERICLFTDHLDDHGYSYRDVAAMLAQLKIAGPDLTVRPGGLVAPEKAAEELPKAAGAFRDHGLSIPMISTGLTSAADPTARPILAAMGQLGIRYYKLGYVPYGDLDQWESQLNAVRKQLAGLVGLGKAARVQAGLHNHAGPTIGGAVWDAWQLLEPLDPEAIGFYFDAAQATIEGGNHAWRLNFQRISPRLKMIAIKDFIWEKANGRWRTRWVPLGEGMVNWPDYFRQLARLPFSGPISLHIEYDPGGATPAERFENSLAAAERDLTFLRKQLTAAFAQP